MRNRSLRALLPTAALLSALLLAACAGQAAPSSPPERSRDPSPEADRPEPTMPTADISEEGLAALVARAADDAGVAIDEVRIVTAEEVTWSDGSLGCPQPGMAYTQALVAGYRVVLEIGGDELNFHAAQGGEFFFCEDPHPPVEGR
jgi:hypothetical protein